jgi:hypothetical protein
MRTAAEVQADIEIARDELLIADTLEDWDSGDVALLRLRALWDEYAHLPHPRLPSEQDGHTSPRPV